MIGRICMMRDLIKDMKWAHNLGGGWIKSSLFGWLRLRPLVKHESLHYSSGDFVDVCVCAYFLNLCMCSENVCA